MLLFTITFIIQEQWIFNPYPANVENKVSS